MSGALTLKSALQSEELARGTLRHRREEAASSSASSGACWCSPSSSSSPWWESRRPGAPDRRGARHHQRPGAGAHPGAVARPRGRRAADHLPGGVGHEQPAGADRGAQRVALWPLRRDRRLRGGHGPPARPAAHLRASRPGARADAARGLARARAVEHGPRGDLPVRGAKRPAVRGGPARHRGLPHPDGAALDPRLVCRLPAPLGARRGRGQLLQQRATKTYEVAACLPDRLRALGVSLNHLFEAIERNNGTSGGGYLVRAGEQLLVRGEGRIQSLDEIGDVLIETRADGVPVRVRDVARVRFAPLIRRGRDRDGPGRGRHRHRDDAGRRQRARGRGEHQGEDPRDRAVPPARRAPQRLLRPLHS